jgi:preprotein translocase subunit SecD
MFSPLKKVVIIVILTLIAGCISLPSELPVNIHFGPINIDQKLVRPDLDISIGKFSVKKDLDLKLGLDLAGGVHLVFEADLTGIEDGRRQTAIGAVRNVIERRVNLFGISEPNVLVSSFEGKDRIIVELPGVHDADQAVELMGKTAQLQFAEVGTDENPGLIPTDLTGAEIESADVVFDNTTGNPAVSIKFTEEGGKKFAEITERNVGKVLPILLDDIVISAPIVQSKITGDSQITGDFDINFAKELAIQINAGALPVPVKIVEQKNVGATLGSVSVEQSISAGLIGLSMVLVFMILSYGKFGVVADFALVVFGVLTLAVYKLVPVVLTLPGIAGFLLSVGMAVDSNILIFERFKEEIVSRNFADALEVSFGRAWDSIRDANIATLLAAFVLANPLDWGFLHTSGPVRGFAITLSFGIGVSLFTGIVVSRNFLRVFIKEKSREGGT